METLVLLVGGVAGGGGGDDAAGGSRGAQGTKKRKGRTPLPGGRASKRLRGVEVSDDEVVRPSYADDDEEEEEEEEEAAAAKQ